MLQRDADSDEVSMTFLHPNWPSHSFKYPHVQDILGIPMSDMDPRTTTGNVYAKTEEGTAAFENLLSTIMAKK